MKERGFTFTIVFLAFILTLNISAQESVINNSTRSKGMPAYPFPVEVTQPDGSRVTLKAKGDRLLHWYENTEGYTVLRDKAGRYVYAIKDHEENLLPSEITVESTQTAPAEILPGLRFSAKQVAAAKKAYIPDDEVKSNPNPFPTTGTNNVLVILAEFPDQPGVSPVGAIEGMMNAPDYNGTGSFRDYYLQLSYNNLTLNSTVTPWVLLSQNLSYYGANDAFGFDLRPHEMVREAVDLLEADGFDFSPFDNDLDGYVDEIILVHSGYGEQYTGSGDTTIWSHAYHLGDLSVTYDGVILDNYLVCPELYGNSGSQVNSIGTVTHEFAHSLGIPDIYDVDFEGSGGYAFDLNFWDLMAVGSWNNEGITPAGINVGMKEYMGWMTIPVIDTVGSFSLQAAGEFPEAYRLNTPVFNEYFILENRQRTGFDAYIPGEGMLIYHVDLNYPGWLTGEINVDPLRQGFDLEEADDIRDTLTLAGDAFPGTAGITSFDSTTTPGSRTWNGNSSNISIQNIALSGDIITFDIGNTNLDQLPPGWQVDELAYTQQGVLTSIVIAEGDTAFSGYVGAFVGEECRGVGSASLFPPTGETLFEMIIFSNSSGGESLEFRYYNPDIDSIYVLYETLAFASGPIAGTSAQPFVFHTPVQFSKSFSSGWNWFSLNLQMTDMSPGQVFTTCVSAGDYVKNQTQSSTFYSGYGWFGTLNTMNTEDLYIFRASASCGIDIQGVPAPTSAPIDIVSGWNWIAFTPQSAMIPSDALASLSPANLDYIKNQTQSATYYNGYGWFGTLTQMMPGEGYMMRMTSPDLLVYPAVAGAKKALPEEKELSIELSLRPTDYQFNGSITAILADGSELAPSENDVLTAWAGEQCRGAVAGKYFAPANGIVFPLMIHSNEKDGEEIVLQYFHSKTGTTYSVEGILLFEKDMVLGNALEPVEIVLKSLSLEEHPTIQHGPVLHSYPNPFDATLKIEVEMQRAASVQVSIHDLLGKQVEVLYEGFLPAGEHTITWEPAENVSGPLILKFNDGMNFFHRRIIRL